MSVWALFPKQMTKQRWANLELSLCRETKVRKIPRPKLSKEESIEGANVLEDAYKQPRRTPNERGSQCVEETKCAKYRCEFGRL